MRFLLRYNLDGGWLLLGLMLCLLPLIAAAQPQAMQEGVTDYQKGRLEQAKQSLRAVVIQHADTEAAGTAAFYLAQIFYRQGDDQTARLYWQRIPDKASYQPGRRLLKQALRVREDASLAQDVLKALQQLDRSALAADQRWLYDRAMAETYRHLQQPLTALHWIHQGLQGELLPGLEQELYSLAHRLLARHCSPQQWQEAAFLFADTPLALDARLQQARWALHQGKRQQAIDLTRKIVLSERPFPYRQEALGLLDRIQGETWLQQAVGVVLPLSGRYARFGKLVRQAVELAWKEGEGDAFPLVWRDSGSDAARARQQVQELCKQQRVLAVLGPLSGEAARRSGQAAQQLQMPLVTFSHRPGLPQLGDFVFRHSLTAAQQSRRLVDYSLKQKDITAFGILRPDNDLGRQMQQAFQQAVDKAGGVVTVQAAYDPEATDFKEPIRQLCGGSLPEDGAEKADVSFDALFLPDYAETIALLAPQLPFYGISDVQLLGMQSWNSQELLRMAGPYVDGAVFTDGYYGNSGSETVRRFQEAYQQYYQQEPGILEAQAYDTALYLLQQLKAKEVPNRAQLQQRLLDAEPMDGATGRWHFGSQGEAQKQPYLFQIREGRHILLSPGS